MKLTELIKHLEEVKAEHGDIDVWCEAETIVRDNGKNETWRVGGEIDTLTIHEYMHEEKHLMLSPEDGTITEPGR